MKIYPPGTCLGTQQEQPSLPSAAIALCVSHSVNPAISGRSRVQVLGTSPPPSPKRSCVKTGQSATAARHLRKGGFVETFRACVPVGGAAATKLPAGGAHSGHCEIQDLTSESTLTDHPALRALPALTRREPPFQLVSLPTIYTYRQADRDYTVVYHHSYSDNSD